MTDKMKTCPDCGGPAIFCPYVCKKLRYKRNKAARELMKKTLHSTGIALQTNEATRKDKEIKANELIVQRIRSFFDAPNFVQPDLTRDAFYEILTASKLEANGHKEQEK